MPTPPIRPLRPGAKVERPKPGRPRRAPPSHTPSAVLAIAHRVALKASPPFDNVLEWLHEGDEQRIRNMIGANDWLVIARWRQQ